METPESKFKEYTFTIPTWALSAIFNDDYSGLYGGDDTSLKTFLKQATYNLGIGHWGCPDEVTEGDFRRYNDVTGGAKHTDCIDLTYYVHLPVKWTEAYDVD